jgi:hypothetical protein
VTLYGENYVLALIDWPEGIEPICQEIVRLAGRIGVSRTGNWPRRKTGDVKRFFPDGTRPIVLMSDRVGHPLVIGLRKQADKLGVPQCSVVIPSSTCVTR